MKGPSMKPISDARTSYFQFQKVRAQQCENDMFSQIQQLVSLYGALPEGASVRPSAQDIARAQK